MKKHPVEKYIEGVLDGSIPACEWVKKTVQRHLDDLEHGHKRGLTFDPEAAERVIQFFNFLRHSKGEWAGKVFILSGWELFILWVIFGWMRADGTRRFRTAYNEVPRKNGKSTFAAGIGLYMAFGDGEPGAEVYSAATKRDQARITHEEATRMVKTSPELRSEVDIFRDNLSSKPMASKYEPLGADSDSMDGLNIHAAIIDELHAHKNRKVWDVLETALGSRRQPLIFVITTAGFDRHSVCYEQHDYVKKILDGIINDDAYFGFVSSIDEEKSGLDDKGEKVVTRPADDWNLEETWRKANPNYGICVKPDNIRELATKAANVPAAQNAFKRLRLNIWTESETLWIDKAAWDRCAGEEINATSLIGRECWGGLDLGATGDLTALVLLFPDEEYITILPFFWVPKDNIRKRAEKDRVPYDVWVDQGFIEATDGNVTDYNVLRHQINEMAELYKIREIAYDRWNSSQLVIQLTDDGANMVPFGQGFASMAGPTKEFESNILGQKYRHGGNPVLSWMISNTVVREDPAGNLKPAKDKSTERIDGVVAAVMAQGRMMAQEQPKESVYKRRGLITV